MGTRHFIHPALRDSLSEPGYELSACGGSVGGHRAVLTNLNGFYVTFNFYRTLVRGNIFFLNQTAQEQALISNGYLTCI